MAIIGRVNDADTLRIQAACNQSELIKVLADRDIYSTVTKLMYDFEGRTGKKPTAIYLGFNTLKDLKRQLNSALMYQCQPDRSSLAGVPIYEVDCAEHLNVS